MKGFLDNLFSVERRIASDFLTAPLVNSHAKISFCAPHHKSKAVECLADALKKVLDSTEYQKLPWFGEVSQKAVARKVATEFFRCRLKSFDFPLRYDCYYIDEISNNNDYCDYFYVSVNPDLNYDAAVQKLTEFMAVCLKKHFPTLSPPSKSLLSF